MRTHRLLATISAALAVAAIAATGPTIGAGASPERHRLRPSERRLVLDATRQFTDVDTALAAGYVPVGACAELPGVGGMGLHYLHPVLASDTDVDPAHPELLVYSEGRHGALRLVAVEYFVADADQDLSTADDRPSLFDRYAFDGPMPGHEPGMPIHYDLHVWLYRHNPAGQLAAWNPTVRC